MENSLGEKKICQRGWLGKLLAQEQGSWFWGEIRQLDKGVQILPLRRWERKFSFYRWVVADLQNAALITHRVARP
jgi:hypothetical protein